MRQRSPYFLGLDLGQSQDPTALALLEREDIESAERDPVTFERRMVNLYRIRGLKRLPLGTRYPDIVRQVNDILDVSTEGHSTTVVVDATGVGAPVVDMLREELRGKATLVPVIFTAGDTARFDDGVHRVPKKDLVHGLLLEFEQGRLRVPDHPLRETLLGEFRTMRVKITGENHAGYEAWRQGQHDDMVFAVALACWAARRGAPKVQPGLCEPLLWT